MKKRMIYCESMLVLFLFMITPLSVGATEADGEENKRFRAGTVWEVIVDTDAKEKADEDSETVYAFMAGTLVVLLEDEQDDWVLAQNKLNTGYIPTEVLQTYKEEKMDTINQEFERVEKEQIRTVEEQEVTEKEKRSSYVWKFLIILFAVLFVGIGIYDAFKREV